MIKKIILIGAGNVATQLSKALLNAGKEILQIYSRTESSASGLAHKINCPYTTRPEELLPGADLYIIAVSDAAIEEILKTFQFNNALVAHTSGSTDIKVLYDYDLRPAVFYPLQTFSKDVDVDFNDIPLFIEAKNDNDHKILTGLAKSLSSKVFSADSRQRMLIHIAAIFACNFTNHFFYLAENLLKKHRVDFDILMPLIKETVRKVELKGPFNAQTGPAVRSDKNILKLHSEMLSSVEDYQKIYNFISESIITEHTNNREKHKNEKL